MANNKAPFFRSEDDDASRVFDIHRSCGALFSLDDEAAAHMTAPFIHFSVCLSVCRPATEHSLVH